MKIAGRAFVTLSMTICGARWDGVATLSPYRYSVVKVVKERLIVDIETPVVA
jgi:hypothetical protein